MFKEDTIPPTSDFPVDKYSNKSPLDIVLLMVSWYLFGEKIQSQTIYTYNEKK